METDQGPSLLDKAKKFLKGFGASNTAGTESYITDAQKREAELDAKIHETSDTSEEVHTPSSGSIVPDMTEGRHS